VSKAGAKRCAQITVHRTATLFRAARSKCKNACRRGQAVHAGLAIEPVFRLDGVKQGRSLRSRVRRPLDRRNAGNAELPLKERELCEIN
jgi:hypothetical protein